jgi:hypothetical protein
MNDQNSTASIDTIADDVLYGAQAIAAYLNWPVRRIYHFAAQGHLPVVKVGPHLVARKHELDRRLSAVTSGEAS